MSPSNSTCAARYVEAVGGVVINVDEKFKHMQIKAPAATGGPGGGAAAPVAGKADDAFGSDDDDDDDW